ncbi:restriction endonuclease subunit S [Roseovarius sp.]|uniref:restriction endonuclease subunit S n=1 Tax=Roseovarius sp. TaxID=1486281 RepID=UPI0035650CD8
MTELVPLGEFANVFNGKTPAKSDQRSAGHPVLKIKDVDETGEFRGTFESFVDPEFAERHIKKRVVANDILVLNAAHNADYVGSKTYKAQRSVDGAVATGEWLIARSSDTRLHQDYLWHWFQAPATRFQIRRLVKGIHLYPRDVAAMRIPLPPVEEQRRIAAILDKADAIRRKRQQALALADDFLKSAYVHLVGHRNPAYADWKPETIEKLAQDKKGAIRSGPFGSALLHSEFVDEGIAVLGIDNAVQNQFAWGQRRFITEEKYEELRRYRVFPGDVIITIMGTTGRSAVVPDDIPEAITTKHLASITCDTSKILPEVLSFAIHSDPMIIRQIKQHNKGAIMDGLNLGIIKKLVLPKPPMKLQQRFADALRSVSKHKQQISAELGDGTELFASLSQRAFRGEL